MHTNTQVTHRYLIHADVCNVCSSLAHARQRPPPLSYPAATLPKNVPRSPKLPPCSLLALLAPTRSNPPGRRAPACNYVESLPELCVSRSSLPLYLSLPLSTSLPTNSYPKKPRRHVSSPPTIVVIHPYSHPSYPPSTIPVPTPLPPANHPFTIYSL